MEASNRVLGLTKKQRECLDFIKQFIDEYGFSPGTREIARAMGTSLSNAHRYIHQLRDRGVIDFADYQRRTISIKERSDAAPL